MTDLRRRIAWLQANAKSKLVTLSHPSRHMAGAEADQLDELPVPAPWAAAVAVLALLAFGVFVGSAVSPPPPSNASTPMVVAVTPQGDLTEASSTSKAPAVPPSPTEPQATPQPAEEAPEGSSAATSTSQATASPKAGRKDASQTEGGQGGHKSTGSPASSTGLPPIKHVFLIVLSDEGFDTTFGADTSAGYLSKTLTGQGELVDNYYAIAGGELANEIGLISGQGPTPQTVADCPSYTDLAPSTIGSEGQVSGSGCVYPSATVTLADQLAAAGKTWKAYVEDIDAGGTGQATSCIHPPVGAQDPYNAPTQTDGYVTWRNPFVYFHSLIDGSSCARDDVGIGQLTGDLTNASTTPSLAYIVPDRCHDGSSEPCAPGQPAGTGPAETFLRKVVPEIESSPAYTEGGLIAITFDQAPQSGPDADSSGCCTTSSYPNLPSQSSTTPSPAGGGRVGLLLISKYVKPNSINVTGDYNHFALLRSIEDLFGLKPLGYAGTRGLLVFDSSIFNANP